MAFTPLKQFKTTLDTMLEYISRLWFLAEVRWPADNIRVTITDWVISSWNIAISNQIAISNHSAIWGYQASTQVQNMMNMEATLANIDNLIIN